MKNEQLKVTIIVPAYNAEDTISKCIDSILGQTLKELELIIIDDGSMDRTNAICNHYADERLRWRAKWKHLEDPTRKCRCP